MPTPVGLGISACGSQGMSLGAVGEHGPDLAAAFEDDMSAVRRPRGEVVASLAMGELHPLMAGDVHEVDVLAAGRTGSVMTHPCIGEELPVRRPGRRDGVSAFGDFLGVSTVGFHHVYLWNTGAVSAHPGDLRAGLGVEDRRGIWSVVCGQALGTSSG